MSSTILVAADGTPEDRGALRTARVLAERERARIEVLAVHDPGMAGVTPWGLPAGPGRPPATEVAVRDLRDRVRINLRALGGSAAEWPLTVQVGGIARTIAVYASECGASRVVLALPDPEGSDRWKTREMLRDLIPRLQVPVLAVPPRFEAAPRRVVVGVDFSRFSLEIAREAVEEGAQLHLVHVVEESAQGGAGGERLTRERKLGELATELELPGVVAVEAHIRAGDPADEILALAAAVDADLIAAGSHGLAYPGQVLTGDVWGRLVHMADRPLLLGPPRGMLPPRPEWEDDFLLQETVSV